VFLSGEEGKTGKMTFEQKLGNEVILQISEISMF
jgi:hypothetical protein